MGLLRNVSALILHFPLHLSLARYAFASRALHLFTCYLFVSAFSFGALTSIAPPATAANVVPNPSVLGTPIIRNFDAKLYKAHNQNWVALQDRRGVMFFGNSDGILEYDGQRWQNIVLSGAPTVRSLAMANDGTIFYGTVGDFGYLKVADSGKVIAVSLKPLIAKDDALFNDVWQIENTNQGMVFLTRSSIYRFFDGKVSSIAGKFAPSQATVLNGVLFYADSEKGISLLDGDEVVPIPQLAGVYDAKRIVMAAAGQHEILVGRVSGDFRLLNLASLWDSVSKRYQVSRSAENVVQAFPTELDTRLNESSMYLYKLIALNADSFAISTIKAGVVVFNRQGKVQRAFNKNSGLLDNTVASIMLDRSQNLWAATNSGISHIELSVPQSVFGPENGIKGVALASIFYQGRFYVSTFQDLYYQLPFNYDLKSDLPQFAPMRESTSEIWQFLEVGGDLMAASGRGLYRIKDDIAFKVPESSGNAYCLGISPLWPEHIFVGIMGGVEVFKREAGVWKLIGRLAGVKDNVRRITTDVDGQLWLNTEVQGVLRAQFHGKTATQVDTHRIGIEHGIPDLISSHTTLIDGQLYLVTPKGLRRAIIAPWQAGSSDATRFAPEAKFGRQFADGSLEIHELVADQSGGYFIKTSEDVFQLKPKKIAPGVRAGEAGYEIKSGPFRGLEISDDRFYLHPQGGVWFPGEKLIRVDVDTKKDYQQNFEVLIRRVTSSGKHNVFEGTHAAKGQTIVGQATVFMPSQNKDAILKLPYEQNALVFEFAAAFYEKSAATRFQFQLEGFDKTWSEWDTASAKEYTNIPEGKYRFRVRAQNVYGTLGQEANYAFEILPPWFRTWWAYLIWVSLGFFSVLAIVHFYTIRLKSEKNHLEELVAQRTQELKDASLTDPLTGLRNRRFIAEVLHSDVVAFAGYKNHIMNSSNHRGGFTGDEIFGVFLLDMDHFKQVNDTYGHEAGDQILKQFAEILIASVRKDDVIVRLGGEEFLVVLKKTKPDYIHTFAKKILKSVAEKEFDIGDGTLIHKTCSIGYAHFPFYAEQPNLMTFEQCIVIADLGMYHAKHSGRNRAVLLSASTCIPASDELLRKATSSLEFALREGYFQIGQLQTLDE
jgi:diguanylate cyclase (GGDEF)-like protein